MRLGCPRAVRLGVDAHDRDALSAKNDRRGVIAEQVGLLEISELGGP